MQWSPDIRHSDFRLYQYPAFSCEHWRRRRDYCWGCCEEVRCHSDVVCLLLLYKILLPRTCLLTSPMACRLSAAQPSTTYYSVKRFMGQQLKETKQLAGSVSRLPLQNPRSMHPWQLSLRASTRHDVRMHAELLNVLPVPSSTSWLHRACKSSHGAGLVMAGLADCLVCRCRWPTR